MGLAATLEPSVKVSFDPGTERSSGDAVSVSLPIRAEGRGTICGTFPS